MYNLLDRHIDGEIIILSGSGIDGYTQTYGGKRTAKAIKSRLTKEKCCGDRWARAYIHTHNNDCGKVYTNIEDPTDMLNIHTKIKGDL